MNDQKDLTTSIRAQLPSEDTTYDLAELFKALGDPTRAKILSCLQIRDQLPLDALSATILI